jgi:hypothetical protein
MDALAAAVVASLYRLRGSTDARGLPRPTEDDVGDELLRAAGDCEPVASETKILESAIPALKALLDESTPQRPWPLLDAMDIAIRALSQLHGLS